MPDIEVVIMDNLPLIQNVERCGTSALADVKKSS
jgi:hypothetical protein